MSFYVYLIHNIINNKVYVGKAKDPYKRWNKHIKVARGVGEKEKFYIHRELSKKIADIIRDEYKLGASFLNLSKSYNVTKENIAAIINNKIWRVK